MNCKPHNYGVEQWTHSILAKYPITTFLQQIPVTDPNHITRKQSQSSKLFSVRLKFQVEKRKRRRYYLWEDNDNEMEITKTLDFASLPLDGSTLLLYLLSGYLNNKNLFDNIEIVESGFRRDALANILRTIFWKHFVIFFNSVPTQLYALSMALSLWQHLKL